MIDAAERMGYVFLLFSHRALSYDNMANKWRNPMDWRNYLKLRLIPLSRLHRTAEMLDTDPVWKYAVDGTPEEIEARIRNRGNERNPEWQFFYWKDDVSTGWTGDYKTAEEALAALETELISSLANSD